MKFGIVPINIGVTSVEQMIENAQAAEAAGLESVWTFEHVIVPLDYASRYPYSPTGKMGAEPETVMVDPLIALAAIGAATKTIRLATGVNILSQANPLFLAKQAASLDFISNGRLMLGLGIGWLKEEFKAMGTPFEKRGARFDDYVAAMRKVWSGEVVEHDSEFLSWHGFKSYPVPVQNPLPVHIGGNKGKAFTRTAQLGDGWFAPSVDPNEIAPQLELLKAECEAIGRDHAELEISAMWVPQAGMDAVKAMQDIGVHRLVAPIMDPRMGKPLDIIKQIGDDIVAKV